MSVPRRRVELTPRARHDFDEILLFTLEHWGPAQADAYERTIDEALRRIAAYPELGKRRGEFESEVRCFPVRRHLVLYGITHDAVVIYRLLHERRDIGSSPLTGED